MSLIVEHLCERCRSSVETSEVPFVTAAAWHIGKTSFWICLPCLRAFSIEVVDRLEAAEVAADQQERPSR